MSSDDKNQISKNFIISSKILICIWFNTILLLKVWKKRQKLKTKNSKMLSSNVQCVIAENRDLLKIEKQKCC